MCDKIHRFTLPNSDIPINQPRNILLQGQNIFVKAWIKIQWNEALPWIHDCIHISNCKILWKIRHFQTTLFCIIKMIIIPYTHHPNIQVVHLPLPFRRGKMSWCQKRETFSMFLYPQSIMLHSFNIYLYRHMMILSVSDQKDILGNHG